MHNTLYFIKGIFCAIFGLQILCQFVIIIIRDLKQELIFGGGTTKSRKVLCKLVFDVAISNLEFECAFFFCLFQCFL